MRNFVFRKVLYKKWQNSGMLFAIILLVGIVCSNPLYRAAVGQKMVCTNLDNTYEKSKVNPGYVSASGSYVYGKETAIASKNYTDVTKLSESLQDMLQMPVITSVKHFGLQKSFCKKEYTEDGAPDDSSTQIGVGYIEQLDKHVNVRLGKMYG